MKRFLVLILAVTMVLPFSGCGTSETTKEVETIKIGLLAPLTGDGAIHGVPVVNASQLAVDEINAAGGIDGKMIELVALDTKADTAAAVNAYNKLKDQEKVVAIVGGTYSAPTLAFIETAVADNMPIITPTATNLNVTLVGDNVFRVCYTDKYQGSVCSAFAVDTLDTQVPAVLFNKNNAYSEGLASEFITACEKAGITAIAEAYSTDDVDFSSQLTKITDAGADVLFLPDYTNIVGSILTQVDSMEMDVICLGGDGWNGIIDEFAEEAEGYYFANHYSADDESAIVQKFVSSYTEKYGETPNALSALTYDAVYILVDAIKAAGSTESKTIIKKLAATDRACVTGQIIFDADGNAKQKSISIIQVVDGEYKLYEEVTQ